MDLEKRDYIQTKYEDVYEDEIDLKELFLILWRNKIKIILSAVICMIIGFGAGKVMSAKNRKSTVIVEYTYPGIEQGKSPDGNILGLTYNQFKNIFMIKDIYHKMPELEQMGISEDTMLNAIKITPVLPENLAKGEVFNTNKFMYSLKITGTSEKDEEVLRNFVEVQRDYFKRNYKIGNLLPILKIEDNLNYDYPDIVSIVGSVLDNAILSTDSLRAEMITSKDKSEIQTISRELKVLREINLGKVSDMVNDYGVTKNPAELMVSYRQLIEDLGKRREKVVGKIAQLESMIKNYKPAEKDIVIMNNGNSEKVNTESENYYTEFLRQLAVEKIKLSDIDVEIKYTKEKMVKEINQDSKKIEDVNKELDFIIQNLNEKTEEINSLIVKNYNRKYAEIIKISENVATKSNSKVPLTTAAGFILGGFLGVCYVFLANFIYEEKRKNAQNKK